jgi:hypothetical protein
MGQLYIDWTKQVYASYHLTFAPTSQVVVRALSPTMDPTESEPAEDKWAIERAKAADP